MGSGATPTYDLASWWHRVLAVLIDGLILNLPFALLFGVRWLPEGSWRRAWVVLMLFVWIVGGLLYAPALLCRGGKYNGQTFGKQCVGVRVVRVDGQRVDFAFGLFRELVVKELLFGFVGALLLYVPTFVNYLWPLWDEENRALHDKIVKSRVVRA